MCQIRYSHRQLGLLLILMSLLIGCGPSAEDIADEVSQELQKEVEQQVENAWEAAQQWVKDEVSAIWDDVKETAGSYWDDTQDWAADQWQNGKEWAGLDVPVMVGEVAFAQTELDHDIIKEAFTSAYSEYKLWLNLGEPDGPVSVYAGDVLIQYFEKDEERSAIVMADNPLSSSHEAYAIPREWLVMYEALGGAAVAGIPTSKPENYRWLWQGKRQEFLSGDTSERYGLFQANGEEAIYVIPPHFYQIYLDEDALGRLGYPLSNMPLDNNAGDSEWRERYRVDAETETLLTFWQSQPYRVQIFEKGSLWFNSSSNSFEIVERMGLIGGETKLSGEVGSAFSKHYSTIQFSTGDECYEETVRHMANAANGDFGEDLLRDVAFLPLESVLTGVSLGVQSISAKIALSGAEYFLSLIKEESFAEANKAFVAGFVVDSFYEKAIGDYLAVPLGELTSTAAEIQYQFLQKDRLSREIQVTADYGPYKHSSQLNLNAILVYDPLTNVVNGVIESQSQNCPQSTYVYQFRLSENPEYNASFILQSGELEIYDLVTGAPMP